MALTGYTNEQIIAVMARSCDETKEELDRYEAEGRLHMVPGLAHRRLCLAHARQRLADRRFRQRKAEAAAAEAAS